VLNAVSARLGTKTLRELDAQVVMHGQSPHRVAQRWLAGQALPAGEGANA
jgi:glycine betaine/choline ABC-type transport system substrate-binding protein